MKNIILFIGTTLLMLIAISANSQDTKAKAILDKLSAKAKTFSSIQASFEYKMTNKADGIDESQKGTLKTQGEKYQFNIAGQIIISDGKTVWTIIEDAEEVQINEVPEDENSDEYINPVNVLTLWEKGFKYKYDSKLERNSVLLDVINLYPEKADEKSFHTVKLFIDQNKMEVIEILLKGKDGTDFTYIINSFTHNKTLSPADFTFKPADHPDFEIIDLR